MNIGKDIAKIRKKRKINRRELAKRTGIPYQTLNNIEADRVKEPRLTVLAKIAHELDVSLETLVLGKTAQGIEIKIPPEISRILKDPEVKKFFSLIEAIDVKGIRNLKKLSKYFQKVIDQLEVGEIK